MPIGVVAALSAMRQHAHLNAFAHVDWNATGSGMVIAVKDNIHVKGMPTRAGSILLDDRLQPADAPVVAALRAAGCIIIGKTNMHEFAFGGTGDNPHFGPVYNPANPALMAGGSSGGSAAAVAARMCDAALGTDTGGSVRGPAAMCGVVGFKPRRALLSRQGVFPLSRSLDAVGVLAPDVATASAVLTMASGVRVKPQVLPQSRLRLVAPRSWHDGIDDEVRNAIQPICEGLPGIDLPDRDVIASTASVISLIEATWLHRERYAENSSAFGDDLQRQFLAGREATALQYLHAIDYRSRWKARLRKVLSTVDAIVLPTLPCTAQPFGVDPVPLRMRFGGWTRPFNYSDTPAISIPVPTAGLPVGLQIVAMTEQKAVDVAASIEAVLGAA